MPGTESALFYQPTRFLRASYAMSGTDLAYQPTPRYAMSGTGRAYHGICLSTRYTMSGTGIAYRAIY
eukprot:230854-Rhodomonas_salina.2